MRKGSEYLKFLSIVASADVAGLEIAEKSYGDSWKKRGGVGAFMMLARKWDRLERQVEQESVSFEGPDLVVHLPAKYDIFLHAEGDKRAEGIIDDIRDLRRYLLLVEAELCARKLPSAQTVHRDNR